jgi:putative endopeptidase
MTRVLGFLLLLVCVAPAVSSDPSPDAARYLDRFVDSTVSPREDFYRYAVGRWMRDNPIPATERSWGVSHLVQEETYRRLLDINAATSAQTNAAAGSNAQKIGDFWYAAMDSATRAAQGITPLAAEFARIDAIRNRNDLVDVVARLQHISVGALFFPGVWQDEMNSNRFVLHLWQGGLGLPDRDYYFDTDERATMLRQEYGIHLARMFELLGDDAARAQANASTVMAIETGLAGASRKLADLRDSHANYNAMSVAALAKRVPSIDWKRYLKEGRFGRLDSLNVGQPEFFDGLEQALRTTSIDDWKTYLRWRLVDAYASQAGGKFDAQNFRFFGTLLNGTPEQRPRWKRMLDEEENYLGDALGQLYVERYFSPATKARYERLTEDIFAAFRERLGTLEWMSDSTRRRALGKLAAVTRKVGYPTKWKDYSSFRVERGSFLTNCVRGNAWSSDDRIAKLHKPVDRTEWGMTPQTYNAYYNPSNNEIVLPAAVFILPGIADSLVDDAIVYAYAGGATIGHEIIHGFDDEGRKFDEHGNLVSWWTERDAAEFERRAERIVHQYDGYVAVGDLHVNGAATAGENIADLGGMVLGWEAFKKTEQYRRGESLGGFTPAQRYFIGWALGWMNQIRPENLAVRVKTDVHAPSFLRVIGPATNLPPFYEAFGVQPGDRMYRDDAVRVEIW